MTRLAGMSCLVEGTIPPSSGLSSSSALVCCAGLVTTEANEKFLSKVKFPFPILLISQSLAKTLSTIMLLRNKHPV